MRYKLLVMLFVLTALLPLAMLVLLRWVNSSPLDEHALVRRNQNEISRRQLQE